MRHAPLVLVTLLLAGCLEPVNATLRATDVEPPEWNVGDWWTYRVSSDVFATEGEITIVVAEKSASGYVLGVPADADATFALLQHVPALGPVTRELRWDVHETPFRPLEWPLEDGREWDTTWISGTIHFTSRLEDGVWNVSNAGFEADANGITYNITYDPDAKWFTRFTTTAAADGRVRIAVELLERGEGYAGEVRAPGSIRVVLMEGRANGVLRAGAPASPSATFTPPAEVDTLLVGCLAGGQPGQYHAEVRSPTGVVCQLDETIPPGDGVVRAQVVELASEEGAWEARLAAGGPGVAVAEVLGYETRTYTLG